MVPALFCSSVVMCLWSEVVGERPAGDVEPAEAGRLLGLDRGSPLLS